MDLDKIIEGLLICSKAEGCDGCPYEGKKDCGLTMLRNAAAAVQELRNLQNGHRSNDQEAEAQRLTITTQEEVIEALQATVHRLEGKVEAYERVLCLAIE